MKIEFLKAEGIHHREIEGIDRFKQLPGDWYGYANLEQPDASGRPRQIDVVLVIDDRIILVDLKDWYGTVTSDGRRWSLNGKVHEGSTSPVHTISDHARLIASGLKTYLLRQKVPIVPFVDGYVVMTGRADYSGVPDNERKRIFDINEFCTILVDKGKRYKNLSEPTFVDRTHSLVGSGSPWRHRLDHYFGNRDYFKPQEKIFGNHRIIGHALHRHKTGIYEEFDAQEIGTRRTAAFLRYWDFTQAEAKYASQQNRKEIAGRELEVINHLLSRSAEAETVFLRHKTQDRDVGMHFWEIFERHRDIKRFNQFMAGPGKSAGRALRLDLARALLKQASILHGLDVAHCDLNEHSVWLELPTTVRLSHLFLAKIPEGRSIFASRMDFLEHPVIFPEDTLGLSSDPFQKDVFLLGRLVHRLLFGVWPVGEHAEWDAAVDNRDEYRNLHAWFAQVLDAEPDKRFRTATSMLDAFNAATAPEGISAAVLDALHRFRGPFKNMAAFFRRFPSLQEIEGTSGRASIYRTADSDCALLVKQWERAGNWEDEATDGARLLAFCRWAERLAASDLNGIVQIRGVFYLQDCLSLVLDFVEGPTLQELLAAPRGEGPLGANGAALTFLERLTSAVTDLHEAGFQHGDINPSNIICQLEGADGMSAPMPVLIDLLELGRAEEGERLTPGYSPPYAASPAERDRFAVLRIVDEVINHAAGESAGLPAIRDAIETCRTKPPLLGSLSPLLDTLRRVLAPVTPRETLRFAIPAGSHAGGRMRPDNHEFHVCLRDEIGGQVLEITGAEQRLTIRFNREGKPVHASTMLVSQNQVGNAMRHRILTLQDHIELLPGMPFDPASVDLLLERPEIQNRLRKASRPATDVEDDSQHVGSLDDELAPATAFPVDTDLDRDQEADAEQLAALRFLDEQATQDDALVPAAQAEAAAAKAEKQTLPDVSIPLLWNTLVEVEEEDIIEVRALAEPYAFEGRDLYVVPVDFSTGAFEFEKEDQVSVLRVHGEKLIPVGHLDVARCQSNALAIDFRKARLHPNLKPCREGDLLRLESKRESESRNRRKNAIDRILRGDTLVKNLARHFQANNTLERTLFGVAPDASHLESAYGLNESQIRAFQNLWTTGGLGLLQGPPGTGKTRFIAAFIHYALTKGGIQNVLIASQSHEAVDQAVGGVIALFNARGEDLSLVRLGQQRDSVSEAIRHYHQASVEEGYKDTFRAKIKEKILLAGGRIGFSEKVLLDIHHMVTVVRPVLRQLESLRAQQPEVQKVGDPHSLGVIQNRIEDLEATVRRLLATVGYYPPANLLDRGERLINVLLTDYGIRHLLVPPEMVRRLIEVIAIVDDWIGHVSNRKQSFEEFLMHTRQVACGTCVGLGKASFGVASAKFDLVVIDEAGRCNAGELAVPMQSGRKIILVGDHKQLEPHHDSAYVREVESRTGIPAPEVRRSDFERVFKSPYGQAVGQTLTKQYRMLPPIGELISRSFYKETPLEPGRFDPKIPDGVLPECLSKPILWIDTASLGSQAYDKVRGSTSRYNDQEADAIIDLLKTLDRHQPFRKWLALVDQQHPIGIVCGYAAQVNVIQHGVARAGLSQDLRKALRINTIDAYQGKENLIVIVSLVRNNIRGLIRHGRRTIEQGFMAKPNRINVALSRAMDRLVIVGTTVGWLDGSPMQKVLDNVRDIQKAGEAMIVDKAGKK
ncbi:hypothetical protein E6C67_31040 [Azospirillum sp. TSA2s]|uniref:AAA domain-containing protein n=1 Tax=Azospirillum sp. TSA2s TaxID=709810 RepID=UPI0010AB3770|nr:AAA domain-containing protein [Azospirillum sp. TSA2s]QCG98128.1 hypothetical protein E6C67_31040 [Azospirillum sp. TSA2s]